MLLLVLLYKLAQKFFVKILRRSLLFNFCKIIVTDHAKTKFKKITCLHDQNHVKNLHEVH